MKFNDIRNALFELHNMARGGSLYRDSCKELVVVNPKAKISSRSIHSTVPKSEITNVIFANKVLCDIRKHLSAEQSAFMAIYWGYEDLFGHDVSMNALSEYLGGSYAENRCYILYYRDKNKRCDIYSELANITKFARRTAQNLLHDKCSAKRKKLDEIYFDILSSNRVYAVLQNNKLLITCGAHQ
ncbi:MAG: hypothetical protein EKK64_10925 [Neisseriaceae bacterium]|nr:MAG: hypothetical protein EKK64_10925 [Neisseriaceae bacterium]